jgi:hypothetical protein
MTQNCYFHNSRLGRFHIEWLRHLINEGLSSSVVTPKPANGGQGKTGQREEAGD